MTEPDRGGAVGALLRRRDAVAMRAQPLLLAVAAVAFLVTFLVALAALPEAEHDVRPLLLAMVAVLGVPATAAVNAVEYAATARLVGQQVEARHGFEVAILSSAANLLPLPGALLVRMGAMRSRGAAWRPAAVASAATGLVWLAVTGVLAGCLVLGGGHVGLGASLLGAGALLGVASGITIHGLVRLRPMSTAGAMTPLVVIELAAVAIGLLRYLGVLVGLGYDPSMSGAAALTVGLAVGSALGIFPAGLGVREAVAAALAPLAGLPAAVGLTVVAVDRLIALPVLALMAGALLVRRRR